MARRKLKSSDELTSDAVKDLLDARRRRQAKRRGQKPPPRVKRGMFRGD
jgi:hypothetical protein